MDPNLIQPGQIDPSQDVSGQVDPSQQMPPQGDVSVPTQPDESIPVMASEEQRQQLLDLVQLIRQKLGSLHAQGFAGKNKSERTRRELLRQVFQALQRAGIDLTDRQSVTNFITELRAQNPQLADQFEQSMSVLLGEDISASSPGDSSGNPNPDMSGGAGLNIDPNNPSGNIDPNQNNMNINNINPDEDISQGI